MCKDNFSGPTCGQCAIGFYGAKCLPCQRNPADMSICGQQGICDDGIHGTGTCFCKDHHLDPNHYCEYVKDVDRHHEQEEEMHMGFIFLLCVAFLCTFMLYAYNRIEALEIFPESIAAICVGIIIGFVLKYFYNGSGLLQIVAFEPHTFFLFLLPPIMFQAGFSCKAGVFFRNFLTINAYAIISTVIAGFCFSLIFWYGSTYTYYQFEYIQSLQFGFFISAVDPVATISIFRALNVNDKIFAIVFGESTLNDAAAIALSKTAEHIGEDMHEGELDWGKALSGGGSQFFIYFFGSLFIGAFFGVLFSFFFKVLDLQSIPWIEIGLFMLSSYFPFVLCEKIGCSGILAILIEGIVMRNYAYYSMSPWG